MIGRKVKRGLAILRWRSGAWASGSLVVMGRRGGGGSEEVGLPKRYVGGADEEWQKPSTSPGEVASACG
jgi:hypothetical protein